MAKLPLVPIPGGVRLQPVDARDVAVRLAQLALAEPAGRVPDLAGPKVYAMAELVLGGYLRHRQAPGDAAVRAAGKDSAARTGPGRT